MKVTPSELFNANNKRLTPSLKKRGVITHIYGSAKSVDLYFVDNPQTIIRNIPVAFSVVPDLQNFLFSGSFGNIARCVVDVFNESNSRDLIVAYLY